jgi:hypothetical protein
VLWRRNRISRSIESVEEVMETITVKVTLSKPVITPNDRIHLCAHLVRELLAQNVLPNPRKETVELDATLSDKEVLLAITQ